jgi:hypothetical protein
VNDIPPNIHRFNVTALLLFEHLYNEFPRPVPINAQEIGFDAAPEGQGDTEIMRFAVQARYVVTWLTEEGFIRHKGATASGDSFWEVRLTLKGLSVLGYLPTSVQQAQRNEPLIEKIKHVLAGGAEKAGAEAVKSVLTEAFRLAYQYGPGLGGAAAAIAT